MGFFVVVVVVFCSTGGVGWWGLAPRWVGMACRVACGGFLGGSRWYWLAGDVGWWVTGLFIANKKKNNNNK